MVTYGGNRPTVNDNEILTAQAFNDATRFWVTDELPDTGKDGDVVFVMGDPVGAATGGGKVLQVVRGTSRSAATINSQTTVDLDDVAVTITPTKADSAIILISSFAAALSGDGANDRVNFSITDAANNDVSGAEETLFGLSNVVMVGGAKGGPDDTWFLMGYAQPGTTSPVTYKTRTKMNRSTTNVVLRGSTSTHQMFAIEVGA